MSLMGVHILIKAGCIRQLLTASSICCKLYLVVQFGTFLLFRLGFVVTTPFYAANLIETVQVGDYSIM